MPQTIGWKMLIVALTVPFSQFLDIDLLSLLLGIWPHISTGQWTCHMAAHVGTQTAWSLRLHSTGEAHQEHHYRFVTQTPSVMVSAYVGMKMMRILTMKIWLKARLEVIRTYWGMGSSFKIQYVSSTSCHREFIGHSPIVIFCILCTLDLHY